VGSYISHIPWINQYSATLLIACSDGRFSVQLERYCEESRGVEACDRFFVPGGVAGLQILSECFYADKERLALLVTRHAIRTIICVAHEDCGYYREKYAGIDDLCAQQLADLRTAGASLRYWFAGVRVELVYARVTPDQRVEFVEVPPAAAPEAELSLVSSAGF
jgi:hypothetical protein